MTTKEDVRSGFESIGKFIETIGNTIKENKRKQQVEKVLSQFQNPNKIFLNDDGTPKSDSEIAPMLNQGVMSLYQLGEDKLANSLTQYFGQMSKSFDKTSQNAFEYDYKSDGKYFPKNNGQPIAFNERVDYSGVRDEKQYAPQQPKPQFSYRVVNFKGPDGSGQVKYMKENKITGEVTEISSSDYTKEIRQSSNYSFHDSPKEYGRVEIQTNDGQTFQGTYDERTKTYEFNGQKMKASDMPAGIKVRNLDAGFDPNIPDVKKVDYDNIAKQLYSITGGDETAEKIAGELVGYYGSSAFWDKVYETYAKYGKELKPGSSEHMALWRIYENSK